MKHMILVVAYLLFVGLVSVSAQENEGCSVDEIRNGFMVRIATAETLDALQVIADDLAAAVANCTVDVAPEAMFSFAGNGSSLINPIELEPGFYVVAFRATVDETAYRPRIRIGWETADGEEHSVSEEFLTNGNAQGREVLYFEGGVYIGNVEVEGFPHWAITLFPADQLPASNTVTRTDDNNDVLKLVVVEAGSYLFEFEVTSELDTNELTFSCNSGAPRENDFDTNECPGGYVQGHRDWVEGKLYNLNEGVYYLNINAWRTSGWQVTVTRQ